MRLIDADALKEYFKTIRKYHVGKYSEWYLADVLEQQPTVDAVPVTRCGVCIKKRICLLFRETSDENGFCAWAGRKDTDDK